MTTSVNDGALLILMIITMTSTITVSARPPRQSASSSFSDNHVDHPVAQSNSRLQPPPGPGVYAAGKDGAEEGMSDGGDVTKMSENNVKGQQSEDVNGRQRTGEREIVLSSALHDSVAERSRNSHISPDQVTTDASSSSSLT